MSRPKPTVKQVCKCGETVRTYTEIVGTVVDCQGSNCSCRYELEKYKGKFYLNEIEPRGPYE